jgi:precorrin-6Y C5,15-methyltransferase (decarboxylating)
LLALTSDGEGPQMLARLLAETGFGRSPLTVLEALGGSQERIQSCEAAEFPFGVINALNIVAIETKAEPNARVLARASGLPDDLFDHDGQITKREIRALTLSSLSPRKGELLWDVGAGSGSIAIEWMLADTAMRAIAIERREDRAARVRRNAAAFGVPGLQIVEATAPEAFTGLPIPDAIFIGGGGHPDVFDAAARALRSHGRLVANAVTVKTESVLLARHAALGGELTRVAISRAAPVGGETGWRPAMPVTQWVWTKP